MYSDYDLQCMFYLGIEVRKMLYLEGSFMYIDLYLDKIKEIYNDYKNYDNTGKSLLDSIHDYVYENEEKINEELRDCFE